MKPSRLGRGVRDVPRLNIIYPGICLTTKENYGNLSGQPKSARLIVDCRFTTQKSLFHQLSTFQGIKCIIQLVG